MDESKLSCALAELNAQQHALLPQRLAAGVAGLEPPFRVSPRAG